VPCYFAPFDILPFDASVIWHYGEIRSDLERQGTPIASIDAMIAAHARALGAVLVSNNVRENSAALTD
jgi:tRNA(fMet)-specific endonuclease VapC